MREEYKGHCPICQELLGRAPTVILSCTHVFHKLCITSFEKFSKTRACPICRKQSYEKKNYKTSQDYYYIYCITKIQAFIRGFLNREKFIKHMLLNPSSSVLVNRKYAGIHMRRLNLKINSHLDKRESNIDKLFLDLEKKLYDSHAAVSELKNLNRNKKAEVNGFD
jgi:Component of SCF ubiquitin ligase and anaphase-promoting complex